ncbi:MAG: hypothetical protein JWP63_909 [Candidatus Solibacter sp.]|nr:hypothetical protein [Candidatus Solibacter sp.]
MRSAGWAFAAVLPCLAGAATPIAGDQVCAECHERLVSRFRNTPMAKALEPAAQAEILREHPTLTFEGGGFRWRIVREGDRSLMTVTGKGETVTAPLQWAFGLGQAGQTYVFERDGAFYESRVSFYNALAGLDVTMGAQEHPPRNIDEAAGRRMDSLGARDCFGCHSAGGVSAGRLHLESMVPGVGCESCHGPAGRHVTAVRAGDMGATKMAKLAGRGAEEMAELCGRCHRTWSQIALNGPRGVLNVRFQPYRLTNSKCYDTADARIACSACHDPHGPLETSSSAYDGKCAACHSAALHTKVCRVAKANCVTCHMPKVELPGAHARFTDHQIRVARAGDSYPN